MERIGEVKKRRAGFLVVVFALSTPFALRAAFVDVDTAERVASNFYVEAFDKSLGDYDIEKAIIREEAADTVFYIFNLHPGGFVMVAAENVVSPILGYSLEQSYESQDHPPQLDMLLRSYADQILFIRNEGLSGSRDIDDEWSRLSVDKELFLARDGPREVAPLLDPIGWNQGSPWNGQCPADASGPGGHAWAGCVAVAMAQVMKYWSHPLIGEGSYSYYWSPYGTISADFGLTTYHWNSMLNHYPSDATALLLFHGGVGAGMEYGPSGSSATVGLGNPSALTALENFFQYDTEAHFELKSNYETEVWEEMIRTDLDNGRPLIYRGGYGAGGHAFNIDGYQDTNWFHINWGWGGNDNGYFQLTELNPGTHDYTNNQGGIFGLFPLDAEIAVTPPSFSEYLSAGETAEDTLYIDNTGEARMPYIASVSYNSSSGSRSILLEENFASGIPGDWTIIDGGSNENTWYGETAYYEQYTLDGTPFAFVNGGEGWGTVYFEELLTPSLNALHYDTLVLEFDQYYRHYSSGSNYSEAYVDVWNGLTWVNIGHFTNETLGSWDLSDHQSIDITDFINQNLQVRFYYSSYHSIYTSKYWAVDNVFISGQSTTTGSWLTLDGGISAVDTIDGGETDQVLVGFDAAGLSDGVYQANIVISSNDPDSPGIVALTLQVAGGISPPSGVCIDRIDDDIVVTWDPVPDAVSYRIYSSDNAHLPPGSWTLEASGVSTTSWSEPVSGSEKFYYVTADDE